MTPIIKTVSEKKLVGAKIKMCMAENKTFELWRSFMPRRKEIKNNVNAELISMQVYDASFNFKNFDSNIFFEKWATVEVMNYIDVPADMESFILPSGLYAVFIYKGAASEGEKTFRYIFGMWLPNSVYEIDNRPHFEILGEKYKNDSPDSEEEIWIPVKLKN